MTKHEYVPSILIKLILLLFWCHHADSGSIVKFLPGFEGPLPFELETGYIGVGEEEEIQLFYYFIKSERSPQEDPLLLWLSGGPGCSSVTGLFMENGPITIKIQGYDGRGIPNLVSTTNSWTKIANIIFLDQPVGTGFSYSRTQHFDTPSDSGEVNRIHEFLCKWLSKHTEFISNKFYVTGDSYSGKVIPATVQEISKGICRNYLGFKPQINLQGYAIGNPVTDTDLEANYRIPFAHGMALISDELYESLKRSCRGNYANVDPLNAECLKQVEEYQKCISGINQNHILDPCNVETYDSHPRRYIEELLLPNLSSPFTVCSTEEDSIYSNWFNDGSVRKALHVVKGSKGKWIRCASFDTPYNMDIESSVPYHKNNSIRGYRSLIYSGDHDLVTPFLSTQAWIRSLNYSIVDKWRPWMVHNQVAGYTQSYANNMTFATVKGGGHTIQYKPAEGFIMFQRWISGQLL